MRIKARQLEILPKIEKEKNEKKSRIFTAIILTVTVFLTVGFYLASSFKEKKFAFSFKKTAANLNLPLPARNLFPPADKTQDLKEKLDDWYLSKSGNLSGKWAFTVCLLKDNFCWGKNEKETMTAASLIKLPIVGAFYKELEVGSKKWDEVYTLKSADIRSGAGSLQYKRPETKITYREVISLALQQSDNTAASILRKVLGDQKIEKFITEVGMTKTSLKENLTSAEDIALFFKKLYQGEILKKEYQEEMITNLTNTIFETRIPAGLPEGVRVAHKVGTEVGVVSDAGIIMLPENPFVLTILSEEVNSQTAEEIFPKLTGEIYWLVSESLTGNDDGSN